MVKHFIVKRTYQSAINSRNVSDECISNFQRTHPAPIKKEQEKEIYSLSPVSSLKRKITTLKFYFFKISFNFILARFKLLFTACCVVFSSFAI